MRNYEPILMSDLDIRLPGLEVRRLCLNRHLPETDWIRRHSHDDHAQFLLYLTGRGVQEIDTVAVPVTAGKLIFLPPGVPHAFRKEQSRRPLCLVVDLMLASGGERCARESQLTSGELTRVRQILTQLVRSQGEEIRSGALILELSHHLLAAAGGVSRPRRAKAIPVTRRVRRLLRDSDLAEITPGSLAEMIGYQRDHLNRLLKAESGVTAGQLLAKARLERAKSLLGKAGSVGDAAEGAGFFDQNYFARWFKQQTGMTPTQWRREDGN